MPNSNDSTNLNHNNPHIKTRYSRKTIIRLFSHLCGLSNVLDGTIRIKSPSLLISANNYNKDISNRFSFFCANPTECKVFHETNSLLHWQESLKTKPLEPTTNIPFHSGWLGYFSYPETKKSDIKKIIAEFNYYPWTLCFDHQESTLNLLGTPSDTAHKLFELLHNEGALIDKYTKHDVCDVFSTTGFNPLWSKYDYKMAFDKIQYYLRAGDCYQINLTQPYKAQYQGQSTDLLEPLFTQMQPNFGGYFKGASVKDPNNENSGVELISLSPERFISIDKTGRLEAKPIKGTIKRDSDSATDKLLINELMNSSKNQAENLMIVDLLRNDLSKSAIPGSVKVDKLFELESHPNVHHLVSTISAQLKPDISPATAIAQAFPGGSITGAPKIRAMEIINELEIEPRSLYCGSLGYFSDSGHCDFNILIRNLEFRDGTITCWGGGGITVDSEVNDEYEESITKIQRIMDVVESTGKSSN